MSQPQALKGFHRCFFLLFTLFFTTDFLFAQTTNYTLAQCIDTAFANNLTIQQSSNTIALNKLGIKQSKNNLLPTVNGNLSEALIVNRTQSQLTGNYQANTGWSTVGGLTVTQNLFSGLQYLNAIKQSELIYQSSEYDLKDLKFNLTISIVNAFLQVLYTNQAIQIAQTQLTLDSAQLKTTNDLLDVGKKTESDLLQIQSQMRADQFSIVNAISQWKVAKVNLQQLMNLPVSDTFDIDYSGSAEPQLRNEENITSIYNTSLGFQPIIKANDLLVHSAEYAIRIAKGAYYPQLLFKSNVGTNYLSSAKQISTTTTSSLENIGYLQSNPSELVVGNIPQSISSLNNYDAGSQFYNNLSGTFSIGLSIPILNYLQVRNNVKKQQINLNNAVLNQQIAKLNLRKTIEQVYTNTENSEALYKSALEEVDASKAAYDISVDKFNLGEEIITDLLVQKNAYIKAMSDYLQAKYGLIFNQKILDYYKGTSVTF